MRISKGAPVFLFLAALASNYSPASAKEAPPIPPLTGRVVDLVGALPADRRAALEERLRAFEARKGAQVAVLVVGTTAPLALEEYSIKVVEAWGLGRGKSDDGALLLAALTDRAARIEVGYGLEGVLSDLVSKKIIEDIMIPHFRADDIPGGLEAAVDAMLKVIDGEPLPAPDAVSRGEREDGGGIGNAVPFLFLLLFGGAPVARSLFGRLGGGALGGGLAAVGGWFLTGSLVLAVVLALVAFLLVAMQSGGGGFHRGGRGWGGFGGGSGGFRGGGLGGFSGRGGGFGGGGASGRW